MSDTNKALRNAADYIARAQDEIEAHSIGDHPRWPDLEALLRIARAETTRQQQVMADLADFGPYA